MFTGLTVPSFEVLAEDDYISNRFTPIHLFNADLNKSSYPQAVNAVRYGFWFLLVLTLSVPRVLFFARQTAEWSETKNLAIPLPTAQQEPIPTGTCSYLF